MEDRKILALLWNRAERALDAMAKKYGGRLYRTARNILNRHEDAEESVSDTYFAVWNAVPPTRPDPLEGYVYRTGRYIALDRLKYLNAEKRDSRYELSLEELEACIPSRALEETVDAIWLGKAINNYLETLNETNRSIFLRRYWYGESLGEIAAADHSTENRIAGILFRSRKKLKAHLEKEGYKV